MRYRPELPLVLKDISFSIDKEKKWDSWGEQDAGEVFSLENLLDSRFPQLSLGQKNRVNLVRYLVQDFDLLILDESLANVDEKLRQTILLHLKKRFPNKMFLSSES